MNPPPGDAALHEHARCFAPIQDVPAATVTQGNGTVVPGCPRERSAETVPELSTHEPVRKPHV